MADELTAQAFLSYTKNGVTFPLSIPSDTFDVAGTALIAGRPSIGFAAHEALAMGEVASAGWAYFKNCDATNFVQIGFDDTGAFVSFITLYPGQWAVCPLGVNAPYAQADTAAVILDYVIFSR